MGDIVRDTYRALDQQRKQEAATRRLEAMKDFADAQDAAAKDGRWVLRRHTITHYSLEHRERKCRLNLYPGKRRLYWDKERPKGPHLKVERDWTLMDIVRAALERKDY